MMWMSCLIDFSCFGKYVYIYILSQARNRRGEEMGDKFPLMEIFFKHIERKKTKKSPPHQIFSHKKFENPPLQNFWLLPCFVHMLRQFMLHVID